MDPSTQAETIVVDARAKIIWGESPEKVLAFLQSKNVGDKAALELIDALLKERDASIRADGLRKIWVGAGLCAAPAAYYLVSLFVGTISLKLFSVLLLLGLVGLVRLVSGLGMVLRPRGHKGDLSNINA